MRKSKRLLKRGWGNIKSLVTKGERKSSSRKEIGFGFTWKRRYSLLKRSPNSLFQIIRKIKNNSYELDLPPSYNLSNSFNVCDLSPSDIAYKNLWSKSLKEGDDNECLTTHDTIQALPMRITRSMSRGETFIPSTLSILHFIMLISLSGIS